MNAIGALLAAATVTGAAGVPAALVVPIRARPAVVGVCVAVCGAVGAVAGAFAVAGRSWSLDLPTWLPAAGLYFAVDALSGLFMVVSGLVVVAAAVYGAAYVGGGHGGSGRWTQAVLPLFALTLLLVPAAASVSTFLVLWESMALTSLLLVLTEHRVRGSVRSAGVWYAVLTHLGFVVILAGLALFAARAHGETFAALRAGAGAMSPGVRGTVFVLVLVGFASKAGAVPLHAWLPRAHPEAPSHVSALMSAAMVNLGVYGIVRFGMDLLGGGPRWWWLLVMGLGALSAVYGILQAALAGDLKRLLADSTSENLGLVLLGVGAAGLFAAVRAPAPAALALAAALVHLVNHAAFKTLAFLSAGSVVRATGTRDLDALGGLRARMPVTTGLFALAALGAVALPPGNGFVGEWLLVQSLLEGLAADGTVVAVVAPIAVAVIALTAGLAAATFVKALGVGFLARPRSPAARRAREAPAGMLAGMGVAAAACVLLALAPGALGGGISNAVAVARVGEADPLRPGGATVRLEAMSAALSPLWLVLALVAAGAGAAALVRVFARRPRRRGAPLWDCGAGPPSSRMEYTATSFAEPLQRVFDDVLAPEQDVDVTAHAESAYLVERVRYHRRVPDRIERRLYEPIVAGARRVGEAARQLGSGSVHRYLGYGFYGLVAVLIVLAVTR
ncbi:proton-conducting transporter membrane subunit [Embleya sp. AB8]|uniref:proton-conducting transporter transmembrane domain-containing protein n=1 Tax=Embleya sp. AB8 TaxID=3156304 RepID=UPI003C70682D